jgi:hypothetical protein
MTKTAKTPNAQAIGPLEWIGTMGRPRDLVYLRGPTPDGHGTRHMLTCADGPTPPDARLLASAYSAFDRAGRTLGIDAAELAERIDLATVLRWAAWAGTQPGNLPDEMSPEHADARNADVRKALAQGVFAPRR